MNPSSYNPLDPHSQVHLIWWFPVSHFYTSITQPQEQGLALSDYDQFEATLLGTGMDRNHSRGA
jgi:hypothetical protein